MSVVKKTSNKRGNPNLPNPGPGRPKGVRNKVTGTAKDNINAVYEALGSIEAHVRFLKEHPRALADFYSNVYPRLIPLDVQHGGANGGPIKTQVAFLMPRPNANGKKQ